MTSQLADIAMNRLGLLLAALLLSLAARDPNEPYSLIALGALWALAGGMLLRPAPSRVGDDRLPASSLATVSVQAVAWLLLLAMTAAMIHSRSRFLSLNEFASAGLAPIFVLVAGISLCRAAAERVRHVDRLLGFALAVIALGAIIETLHNRHRPTGPLLDSNVLGALLNVGVLLQVGKLAASRGRLADWALLLIIALGQAMTASRGADLTLLAALVLGFIVVRRARASSTALAAAVAIVLTMHLATYALPFSLRGSDTVSLLIDPKAVAVNDVSAAGRLAVWRSTLDAYKSEAPFLGTGLGTYVLVYPRYRNPSELTTTGERAHSDYLERLLEGGPPLAFASFAFGIGLPVFLLLRNLRQGTSAGATSGGAVERDFAAISALCLGLHACVNFILAVPALALLFAIQIARSLRWQGSESVSLHGARGLRALGATSAAIMPLVLFLFALSAWLIGPGGTAFRHENPSGWIRLANLGATLQPSNPRFREAIVGALLPAAASEDSVSLRNRYVTSARREINGWLASNRCDTHAWESLGQLARIAPDATGGVSALDAYRTALDCQPQAIGLRVEVAQELEARGDRDAAYAVLKGGLVWLAISKDGPWLDTWLADGRRLTASKDQPDEAAAWAAAALQIERFRARRAGS